MRTTMTLNDDLVIKLKNYSKKTGQTFKEAINTLLAQALLAGAAKKSRPKSLKLNTFKGKKGLKDPVFQDLTHAEMIERLDESERHP